jgi:hypothetical protein
MRYKTQAKRALRAAGLRKHHARWVVTGDMPGPGEARLFDRVGLYAIVVTWMEADVIAATVANALAQGCDRVLLVDNDSPDDTVARAVAAGYFNHFPKGAPESLATSTFTHHFPYRLETDTRARFDALCGRDGSGRARVDRYERQIRHNAGTISDMSKRYRTLDHGYAGAWSEVENLRRHGERTGVEPEPWDSLVDPADAVSARWYDPAARDAAIESWRARPQ